MKNMLRNSGVVLGAVLLLVTPLFAGAAGPIVRSGESVSVAADQVLEGDFYGFGSTITVSGIAHQDVYLAGGTVTINAAVDHDLVIAGGSVQVHAPIGDDVRVVGGEVVIADHVSGDVVVAGGSLKVLSTASIDGDVLYAGGDVDISGAVKGSVTGVGKNLRIDASIGGNVSVRAEEKIALGDRAEILGNLEYTSTSELARSQGAVVVGDIHKKAMEMPESVGPMTVLMPLLVLLFAALTLFLLFKSRLERLTEDSVRSYGIQGLIGLAAIVGIPVVAGVLFVSILGSLVGAMLFLLYIVLALASFVVAGIFTGTLVMLPFIKTPKVSFVSVIIGMVVFIALIVIPFIGPLMVLALYVIVFGGILMQLYRYFR